MGPMGNVQNRGRVGVPSFVIPSRRAGDARPSRPVKMSGLGDLVLEFSSRSAGRTATQREGAFHYGA